MLGKVLALSTLFSFVLLSAILHTTTPSTVHPLGILFVFILIYMLALGVLTFLLYMAGRLFEEFAKKRAAKTRALSLKRAYAYATVLALAPVMITGIRSIGQMGVYEVALVFVFEIVACFYIAKQR